MTPQDNKPHVSSTTKFTSFTERFVSFKETSPDNKYPVRDNKNNKLDASDLFSFFTADIIREEVTFTR